jgi:thiol-disulfide isomerase/thioredoxin
VSLARWLAVGLFACGPRGAVEEAPAPEKVLQLNQPGEMVNVESSLVAGHVVIVDFWAEWCGACEKVDAAITAAVRDEPRILVRRVHVGDGLTPVAKHYDAGSLPYVRIYDARGALRHALRYNDAFTAGEKALVVADEP